MSTERIEPRFTGDDDEIVTYSRVSSDTSIAPIDPAPVGKKRRSGAMRFLLTTATLAIVAGIGILVVSVTNVAFVANDQGAPDVPDFSEPLQQVTGSDAAPEAIAAETAPEVAGGDTAPDVAFTSDVRRISLPESQESTSSDDPTGIDALPSSGPEDVVVIPSDDPVGIAAIPPAEIVPPVPRPRPEVASFIANTPPPVAIAPSTPGLAAPGFNLRSPVETTAGEIQPAPSGPGNLILDIEETLAKIDADAVTGRSEPVAVAPTPVLPPTPVLEPPLANAPTQFPTASAGLPPFQGDGAPLNVLPPPVFDGGSPSGGFANEGVLLGPVPPEPIPFAPLSSES